jgi:hypothetical protein
MRQAYQVKYVFMTNVLFVLSMLLYIVSFFLPAFAIGIEGKRSIDFGYSAFVIGGCSLFAGPYFGEARSFLPWLANPILWLAVVYFVMGRPKQACISGFMATALSATLLIGTVHELILMGYYAWLASFVVLTVAAGMQWLIQGRLG